MTTNLARGLLTVALLAGAGTAAAQVPAVNSDSPGADLPAVGRSLFDHLTYNPETQQFDIPFPIEELVKTLKTKLAEQPALLLVPKGRSLARSVAAPDFFKFPRMVFGTPRRSPLPTATPNGPNGLGVLAADRLYFGYNERAPVIEIISYNEAAGRFEFQKVLDYAPGKKPRLVYASRPLCETCHKNQAPIFADKQWAEFNGVFGNLDQVYKSIQEKMPGKTEYHGFPLNVDRDSVVYGFDTATDRANEIPAVQKLWSDACGRADPGAIRCRALTLQFGIMYATFTGFNLSTLQIPDSATYTELKTAWDKNWQQYLPGGLRIGNANIPKRDPFADVAAGTGVGSVGQGGISQADKDELKNALANNDIPPVFEPALNVPSNIVWKNEGGGANKLALSIATFLSTSDRQAIKAAHGNDAQKLVAAIAKLQAANEAGQSDVLTSRAIRRGALVTELLKALGVPESQVPRRNTDVDHPAMPQAIAERVESNTPPPVDPGNPFAVKMRPFRTFCAPCHESLFGDERDFLEGDDKQAYDRLKPLAKKGFCRVSKRRMPPQNHDKQPSDAERKAIVDFFKAEYGVDGGNTQCP